MFVWLGNNIEVKIVELIGILVIILFEFVFWVLIYNDISSIVSSIKSIFPIEGIFASLFPLLPFETI